MRSKFTGLIFCLFVTIGCGELYDLRPDQYKAQTKDFSSELQARGIVQKCVEYHGWDSDFDSMQVVYFDYWPHFLFRMLFNPWPSAQQKISHTMYDRSLYTSKVRMLNGAKLQEVWGLDQSESYVIKADGTHLERDHTNTKFYLPTYQYFIQMPLWMEEIPFVDLIGTYETDSARYYHVFASWNEGIPTGDFDQYIFWINQENYRLELMQYTIRDQFNSAYGTNSFSAYERFGPLVIPTLQTVTFNPGETEVLHQLAIDDVEIY